MVKVLLFVCFFGSLFSGGEVPLFEGINGIKVTDESGQLGETFKKYIFAYDAESMKITKAKVLTLNVIEEKDLSIEDSTVVAIYNEQMSSRAMGQICKWALSNGSWSMVCYLVEQAASNIHNGTAHGGPNTGNNGHAYDNPHQPTPNHPMPGDTHSSGSGNTQYYGIPDFEVFK